MATAKTDRSLDTNLLNEFNHRIRNLIRHIGANDDSPEGNTPGIEQRLRSILRRTFLAEWIQDRYIIAVAGIQGAGKTTLIQQLYDLPDDGFLNPNVGQGEKLPVLVTEAQVDAPVGRAWRVNPAGDNCGLEAESGIGIPAFHRFARGLDERVILLELQVPFRHFNTPNMGFMLLPGFEEMNGENAGWQDLTRSVLSLANTCIFVTEPTLLADGRNQKEVEEAFRSTFREVQPILVITGSDTRIPDEEGALRQRVAANLGIQELDRVISTGTDPGSVRPWITPFLEALGKYQSGARSFRAAQLRLFKRILRQDLSEALAGSAILEIKLSTDTDKYRSQNQEVLTVFDQEARLLKDAIARQLHANLGAHAKKQSDLLRIAIVERGFSDTASRFVFGESLEDQIKFEMDLEGAWLGSGDIGPRACLTHALTKAAQARLMLFPGAGVPDLEYGAYRDARKTLGYSGDTPLPAQAGASETYLQEGFGLGVQVRRLFLPSEQAFDSTTGRAFHEESLRDTVKALPILASEVLRIAAFEPTWFGVVDGNRNHPCAIEQTSTTFGTLLGHKREILTGIAVMLGVDLADGHCDSIPGLLHGFGLLSGGGTAMGTASTGAPIVAGGAAAGATAVTAASIAGGLIAAGLLTVAIVRVNYWMEKDEAQRIQVCMEAIVQKQMHEYMALLEEILGAFRDRLENALCARKHLDGKLGRHVNLQIALADMKETSRRMLDSIYDLETSLGIVL